MVIMVISRQAPDVGTTYIHAALLRWIAISVLVFAPPALWYYAMKAIRLSLDS